MKLLLAGSRDFNNTNTAARILTNAANLGFIPMEAKLVTAVCGEAKGADTVFANVVLNCGGTKESYPAKWDDLTAEPVSIGVNRHGIEYNRLAGFNRKKQMAEVCDRAILVWDGTSVSTKDMISLLLTNKKPFMIYDYEGDLIEKFIP